MTKRIFRSIMLVSAVCMVTGLAFLMGVLYHFFGNQLEKELKAEASYLELAVEENGESVLEKLPKNSARVTWIAEDGTVIFDNKADACRITMTGKKLRMHRKTVQELLSDSLIH